ncbi:DUF5060 domain-containing protein [Deinococcus aquiradiocola]|uniref:DUF5060 domain-containing protein n=1 Tax=Deinococcus aquiradiocola TaxID=393059 RepID=A0A917UQI9_9DEIO|nr:DUF5060 domain-containing protein [Deinococcus aquiradiocola]GGJ76286.1 hypothetical protein GCM10008939_20640 [Deinococcus aquiradiocola]
MRRAPAHARPTARPVLKAVLLMAALTAAPTSAQGAMPPAPLQAFTTLALTGVPARAEQFTLLDLRVNISLRATNPYDPAQADLNLIVTMPAGRTLRVPAFWMVAYGPDGTPADAGAWHARFTPTETGTYTLRVQAANPQGRAAESAAQTLTVTPGDAPGFVTRSVTSPRTFADSHGRTFIPIGPNIAWSGGDVLADYERWFDRLAENGGTYARIWMASWAFGIEWQDTGLGDYSARQRQAWLLDRVFQLAQARGIRLELCLLNHGAFSETTNSEWNDNPYNAANGGPLATPAEFATDARARTLFRQRVRYLAARYAAYTSLFAWEWWNEENFTPISEADLRPWMTDMSAYLRGLDPYGHPVTSSFSGGGSSGLWRDASVDFAQAHLYTARDLPLELLSLARQFQESAPDRPVLLAELGYSAGGGGDPLLERIHFHTGLWAPLFLGFAGPGSYWWWDTLIDPQNLWAEYAPLAAFLKDASTASMRPVTAQSGSPDVTARVLRSGTQAMAWLVSDRYSASGVQRAQTDALLDGTYREGDPPVFPERRATLTIRGLRDGPYMARWFDPQTGAWLAARPVTASGGVLTLPTPTFTRDLAVRVDPR